MNPDWELISSEADLQHHFGVTFKGEGWYHKLGDWLLIVKYFPNGKSRGDFKVMCWNSRDPRREIKKVLELPEHK